jgi:uncharacterized protein (DUF2164 family)
MDIPLTKEQHAELVESIRRFVAEEWDLEVSAIRAGFLLEYFLKEIGPLAYNQGVEDAQKFFRRAVEDVPGTCFEEPLKYWEAQEAPRGVRRKPEK